MKNIFLFLFCVLTHYIMAQPVNRYDVVISEIFPDPTPAVGLPNSEYIELTNTSGHTITLDHWKISNGNSSSEIQGHFSLQPDSFVIICPKNSSQEFSAFGKSIGISPFPSLDNTGDLIILLSPEGKTIHAVRFRPEWYKNELKQAGGWSLEICDVRKPCLEERNWKASVAVQGGTPGRVNSIRDTVTDAEPPLLLRSYTIDSMNITAVFNESLDSVMSTIPNRYEISGGIGMPAGVMANGPLFKEVTLLLSKPLAPLQVYTLKVREGTDCSGNVTQGVQEVKAGLPLSAKHGQLRINEILFNPRPEGVDYAELLNRGPGIIDLENVYVGNRNTGGTASLEKCSDVPLLFFPGEYIALTENSDIVLREYPVNNKSSVLTVKNMPSLPDDRGNILILDEKGNELDFFAYRDDYHFPLLSNREGVSLERIDPASPTENSGNWHSCSTDAGYGTPGSVNAQFRSLDSVPGEMVVSPKTFSPDQDGYNDLLLVQYKFPQPGFSCSVFIYDHQGRPVKYLVRNNLCGTTGYFRWNGLDEKGNPSAAGIYHLLAEITSLEGKRKIIKKAVVLAYRLQ